MRGRGELYQVIAEAFAELAALEGATVASPKAPPRRRRLVRVGVVPSPAEPMDEVSAMRAKKGAAEAAKILRSKGYDV